MILLTSQGIPIIHQGQDWAHSQIIAETDAHDPNVGKMDRNPYNKDNETNWVNWLEKEQNKELADYVKQVRHHGQKNGLMTSYLNILGR